MKTELKKEFSKIKTLEKKMRATNGDEFFTLQAEMKRLLQDFIQKFRSTERVSFIDLNKNDFLMLCNLVSSVRPMEPHSFLTRISMCLDEKELLS